VEFGKDRTLEKAFVTRGVIAFERFGQPIVQWAGLASWEMSRAGAGTGSEIGA